jgi:hypothetical protein
MLGQQLQHLESAAPAIEPCCLQRRPEATGRFQSRVTGMIECAGLRPSVWVWISSRTCPFSRTGAVSRDHFLGHDHHAVDIALDGHSPKRTCGRALRSKVTV